MRPDLFLATIGRGSNGSNALEVTEDRAAVTAESQDNIINRVNNVSQYGPSWHYVPGIGVAGTAYAEVPGSALGDLAFTRASSKTRTNSAGVVETIGNNVPPHDYRNADGTLSTFPRLNLEPQRTNSIRNSSMVGAVAGTPGTLPTNWLQGSGGGGLTQTIVGIGVENGLPYIDYKLTGTATGTEGAIRFEGASQIAASASQTWTSSIYSKLISATSAPNSYNILTVERNSGGSAVAFPVSAYVPTSTLRRFTQTFTTSATTAFVQPCVVFVLTIGQSYDFTIRIAAPQMELGAYATTWVPTTTAAVTRLADSASKTGVSSLIGQTEGTLFAEVDIKNVFATTRGILEIRTTGTQTIALICFSDGKLGGYIINGTDQFVRSITTVAGRYKMALAYSAASTVLYINGQIVGSASTSVSVPTTSAVQLGIYGIANHLGDSITQAALFPTRLTNAQLAQLTTL